MRAALVLSLALAFAAPACAQELLQAPTERWYEIVVNGQKEGFTKVTWAPSTWEGKRTLHDTTSVLRRRMRNMAGIRNVFETSTLIELERDVDGTLWWMRTTYTEGGRVTLSELTWTGQGYRRTTQVGDEAPQTVDLPTGKPVMTDAEAFLSQSIRDGSYELGETRPYPVLDERARVARDWEVELAAREEVAGAEGPVKCLKVVDRDPQSGSESTFWLDAQGAFVQVRAGGTLYRRVTRAKAEDMPVEPAEFSVTTPSSPPLERVFNAERLRVQVRLQGDAHRTLPSFPESPWSRTLGVEGDDALGWQIEVELRAYAPETPPTELPIDPAPFAGELEPTPLMPCTHPALKAKAQEVIGEVTDVRRAAYLLARYVHDSLAKASPEVAATTALEILEQQQGDCSEHCVLFVTLCRAAGIPARRVTGYVNIGSTWGAHDWAEIWVGGWIGADPTTGEIGTAARYLCFGYPDRGESHPGLVFDRVRGRLRLVATELEEGGRVYPLRQARQHRIHRPAEGRFVHALAGIELEGVPDDWEVDLFGSNSASIRGGGLRVRLSVYADQGDGLERYGGGTGTYAGAPALITEMSGHRSLFLHSRKRLIQMSISGEDAEALEILERVLAPTFAPDLRAYDAARQAAGEPADESPPAGD